MSSSDSAALKVSEACYRAWTGGQIDKALTYLAENVVIEAPNGRFDGHDGFVKFAGDFAQMLSGVTLRTALGDDTNAVLFCDLEFTFGAHSLTAQHDVVRGGKITSQTFVWDQLPFAQNAPRR